MKKLYRSVFLLALVAVLAVGISLAITPAAEAGGSCPPCYVPDGASGWSQYGSCIGGPKHSPIYYKTYRNNYTGQICRAQSGIPI